MKSSLNDKDAKKMLADADDIVFKSCMKSSIREMLH